MQKFVPTLPPPSPLGDHDLEMEESKLLEGSDDDEWRAMKDQGMFYDDDEEVADTVERLLEDLPTTTPTTPKTELERLMQENDFLRQELKKRTLPNLLNEAMVRDITQTRDISRLESYVQLGADVNVPIDDQGNTLLHFAVGQDWTDEASALLDIPSIDLVRKNNSGQTVLHRAVHAGNFGMVRLLFTHASSETPAFVDAQDDLGFTALHIAVVAQHNEIVQFLIVNCSQLGDNQNRTPLHYAVFTKSVTTFEVLLEHGGDVQAKDSYGKSPLNYAVQLGQIEMIKKIGAHEYKQEQRNDVPEEFICPITREVMEVPVILCETGQTYEREAIELWFAGGKNTDPLTNTTLASRAFVINYALRRQIERWMSAAK